MTMRRRPGTLRWRRLLSAIPPTLIAAGMVWVALGAWIPLKAAAAQILLERAYARSLLTQLAQAPWPWADMRPVARLRVPRLDVQRIVIDTGSGQAMAFGPTLLPGGARMDERGSAVIAAHRDTHFHFLGALRTGDRIEVQDLNGATRVYRVSAAQVVRWDRFAVERVTDRHRLLLSTCYPLDATTPGPLRLVVYADEVGSSALDAPRPAF